MSPWRAVREWASGLDVLLQNPANCSAVELLQIGAAVSLALVALRGIAGALALAKMRRGARPVQKGSRLAELYAAAVADLRVSRAPALVTIGGGAAPMFIAGVWRPFIAVDERVAREMPEEELRVALLHELAHFRRGDNLRAALAAPLIVGALSLTFGAIALQTSFVYAFFRFDFDEALPLLALLAALAIAFVRFVRWRLALGRELACDDDTVRATGDPLLVASALLSFAACGTTEDTQECLSSTMAAPRHACLVDRSNVETRVRRLLEYRSPRRLRVLVPQMVTLAMLLFTFAALVTR